MSLKEIKLTMLDGRQTTFAEFADQVVLVVNVASRCGLSPQYEALEALQKKYGYDSPKRFTVLGMPSNQFMQELGSSEAIGDYCSTTWGVTFPMTEKVKVNGWRRHELFKRLVKAKDSIGLSGPVLWNFEKFLVLPNGDIKRFRSKTKPDAPEVIAAIEDALKG